jgi:hypothetical protein
MISLLCPLPTTTTLAHEKTNPIGGIMVLELGSMVLLDQNSAPILMGVLMMNTGDLARPSGELNQLVASFLLGSSSQVNHGS